jgi:hypothetical protein
MSTNFFAKNTAAAPKKAKAGKKAKARVELKGLHELAALTATIKSLESVIETLKAEVNDAALDHFVSVKNDESFEGFEGATEASMQLRKRSSRSTLSLEESEFLKDQGVSTSLAATNQYVINNAYAQNQDLLTAVSKALNGVEGIPADFIQVAPEKFITTENSLREAFSSAKVEDLRTVLKMVGVPASRVVFGGNHEEMVKILDSVLTKAKDGDGFDAAQEDAA